MAVREYNFIVGPETSTIPTIGVPTSDDDLITKGYNQKVTGTKASPTQITVSGITNGIVEAVQFQIIFIEGSGGAIDVTADPQVADAEADYQHIWLYGCSDTNTVKFEHGTGLILNGNFTMGEDDILKLFYNGTDWIETGRVQL